MSLARTIWIRAALIVLAGVVCYSNSLSGPFVFDDQNSIVRNSSIRSFDRILQEAPDSPTAGRPLVGLTFALNYRLGALDVRGYHLANIAIHLCSALLLFGIVRRTLVMPRVSGWAEGRALERFSNPRSTRPWFLALRPWSVLWSLVLGPRRGIPDEGQRTKDGLRTKHQERRTGCYTETKTALDLAFAVALLWTVHPLNTEAVDYITERTESLMALMYLLTLYASIRALEVRQSAAWQVTAVVACALGMASKESMATAPLVVMLYDRIFVFDRARDALRNRWRLYGGLVLTWLLLAYLILPGPRSGSAGFSTVVGPWTYLLNQTVTILRYLRLAFWPVGLVINYGHPIALTLSSVLPQAIIVATLLLITIVALIRWPAVGFLGAWIFITLAPTSSIVPIATEVGAERRMYLPLMALIACTVLAADGLPVLRRRVSPAAGTAALILVTALLGTATVARNREYASALTLAETTLARWPTGIAHGVVGGELATLGRDEEALPELRIAAAADPRARYNLGITLFNRKDYQAAIRELEILAREHPMREEIPSARRTIGNAYAAQQKWPEAADQYRLALSMRPSDQTTKRLLTETLIHQGIAMASGGRFDEAAASFRQALELDPQQVAARQNLATALYDSGDIPAALDEARQAVALDPGHAASYDLIGRALALQGRYDEAIVQLQQALRLSPNDQHIQDDLRKVLAVVSRPRSGTP